MQTPEATPPPGRPETNPVVQQLEKLKTDMRSMTTQMVADALTDTERQASELETENARALQKSDTPEYRGDPNNPDSSRGKGVAVKRSVQMLLLAASGIGPQPPGVDVAAVPDPLLLKNANDITRDVLHQINVKVGIQQISEQTAPYFHRLFTKLLNGEIKNTEDLAKAYDEIGAMAAVSDFTYNKLRDALVQVGRDRNYGEFEVNQLFKDADARRTQAQQEMAAQRRAESGRDINEGKIIETVNRDEIARDKLKLGELYNAFETTEAFENWYREQLDAKRQPAQLDKYKAELKKMKPDIDRDPALWNAEAEKMALEELTKEIHKKVIYMVNLFFKPVLDSAPNAEFRQVMSDASGPYSPNPDQLLKHLTSRLALIERSLGSGSGSGLRYLGFTQEQEDYIDPVQRVTLRSRVPTRELQDTDFGSFIKELRTIADTERNVLEYSHNFRFATMKGPQGDKGFFEQIAQYAQERISSSDVDIINTIEYANLVQIAKIQLERRYKLAFSKMRWQRDIMFLHEVFKETNEVDQEIRASFIRDFTGQDPEKYPELIIDRCLSHARMLVFGKEFSLHLWSSYSDPRLEKGGQPTYSREELAGASAFNPVDDAIRWGDIDDLNNNGELYLSVGKNAKRKDAVQAYHEGKQQFHESFLFGDAAFEDVDAKPLIAELGNIAKMGGVDAQGGYRVRMAYDQWLNGMLDQNTYNRHLQYYDGPDTLFVDAWKRVENIGVHILNNFRESYMFQDDQLAHLSDDESPHQAALEQKYRTFFTFAFDRYLDYDGSVGKVYVEGKSRDDYVSEMIDLLKRAGEDDDAKEELNLAMYKIQSVILFERSPLEFISMEKPRLTQNGVTLMSEIQNFFLSDGEIRANKTETNESKEFDATISDLVYIEQRARMDSIEDMERIRARSKLNGDKYNLFGDQTGLRSEVMQEKNGVGGYVVNEKYIETILTERFEGKIPAAELRWKIRRAQKTFQEIRTRVQHGPEKNTQIASYEGYGETPKERAENKQKMAERLAEREQPGNMKNRMDWWATSWKDYKFGMTFMHDTADQFMDRNRTGPDTIANAAENCAGTAEAIKKSFGAGFKDKCKEAAVGKKLEPLYEHIGELKNSIEVVDGDIWDKIVAPIMVKRIINTFMKDEKALAFMGDLTDALANRPGSISETYTAQEDFQGPWSWDRNDVHDFLEGAIGPTSGKVISKDLFKEMKKYGLASTWELFVHHILPIFGLAVFAVVFLAASQGAKEYGGDN